MKEAEAEKLKTKSRMSKFLEAVAEGKHNSQQQTEIVDSQPTTSRSTKATTSARNTLRRSKSFESEFNYAYKSF